jgi:hypothetical protein
MSAADILRDFVTPLLTGWRVQFGRWMDGSPTARYCVIRPAGGLPLSLVREPQFTLSFIGSTNDSEATISDAVEAVITAMETSSGGAVFLQPAEPVFLPTTDGRPVFDLAVSAILST